MLYSSLYHTLLPQHIMKPLTAFTGKLSSLDKFRKFKLGSRSSTSAIVSSDSHDSTTGPAPLKAMKGKRKARKNSTENLSVGKGDKGRGKKGRKKVMSSSHLNYPYIHMVTLSFSAKNDYRLVGNVRGKRPIGSIPF